jgi:hypothetical protein
MRFAVLLVAAVLLSCTGSLTEEQRKKIKEEMANSKITRVTDVQITEAAFAEGRSLVDKLETLQKDSIRLDSMLTASDNSIQWISSPAQSGHPTQKLMVEAYFDTESTQLQDNVQKIRNDKGETDSLLYTKPVVSANKLKGVWSVWLSKKKIVQALSR